jgi:hypothetical protein
MRFFYLCAAYALSKKNTGCAPTHRGRDNGHAEAVELLPRALSARAAAKAAASIASERAVIAADVKLVTNGGESGEV